MLGGKGGVGSFLFLFLEAWIGHNDLGDNILAEEEGKVLIRGE